MSYQRQTHASAARATIINILVRKSHNPSNRLAGGEPLFQEPFTTSLVTKRQENFYLPP